MADAHVQDAIRERYGEIARSVGKTDCCSPTACGCGNPISSDLYSADETRGLPAEAVAASLGCGNPTALIDLQPGQTVLDLGSGGGIDVLLSATRVGPTGKVYGLDMTDDMLTLARENQRKAGATNVEFLKGAIEAIPLPDQSVDVIISNCVINLSVDKDAVLKSLPEEYREHAAKFAFKSSLSVPIRGPDGVLGGLNLTRNSNELSFGEEDVRFAQELADHAGTALSVARAYQDAAGHHLKHPTLS